MTHIQLDAPVREPLPVALGVALGVLLGVGLTLGAVAWTAPETKVVPAPGAVVRQYEIRVKGDNCDRSMKLVER